MQKVYGPPLEPALVMGEGNRTEQKEELSLDTFTAKTSSDHTGSPGAEPRELGFGLLPFSPLDASYPHEGDVTLGKAALSWREVSRE